MLGVVPDNHGINLELGFQAAGNRLSLLLRGKAPDMDPVTAPARQLNHLHPDIRILTPEPTRKGLGIGLLGK